MVIALCLVSYDGGGELFTHVLHSVWRNDQLISDLRAEVVNVIGKEGFTRTSLQNLVLMDSVLKEAQRLHPESVRKSQLSALQRNPLLTFLISPDAATSCRESRASRWTRHTQRNSNYGLCLPHALRVRLA